MPHHSQSAERRLLLSDWSIREHKGFGPESWESAHPMGSLQDSVRQQQCAPRVLPLPHLRLSLTEGQTEFFILPILYAEVPK